MSSGLSPAGPTSSTVRNTDDGPPAIQRNLRLLGTFQFRRDGRTVAVPHGAARLVSLLAITGPASRRQVSARLWPDTAPRNGLANLRSLLSKLNAIDRGLIEMDGDVLAVDEKLQTDVETLTTWAHEVIYDVTGQTVISGPPVNAGRELLPGWEDIWLEDVRERLQLLQLQALETAAERLLAAGRTAEALPYALTACHSRPWSENASRLIIEIHARRGDPSTALRQFRRLKVLLENEFGVQPGPDVTAAIRQLYPFGNVAAAARADSRRPLLPPGALGATDARTQAPA